MKALLALVAPLFIAGCANGLRIDTTYSSVSQDSRVQFLVLHFTSADFAESLEILAKGPVSAHYLVRDDPPTIYRLVDDNRRALHAGISSWKGYTQLNASSIGIEIVNLGYRDTPQGRVWADYPPRQIDAVIDLVRTLAREHGIEPGNIVGHSDVAPQRKVDPGPRFPWKRLADAGLIRWPDAAGVTAKRSAFERELPGIAWFQGQLAHLGYAVPRNGRLDGETRNVIAVFQMKYRPQRFDGAPDAETAAMVDVLAASAPPLHASLEAKLHQELEAVVEDSGHRLASLSVLAIRSGRVVYHRQFGDRYIDEANPSNSRKADTATMYRVASISKPVTTIGLLRLVDEGKAALDADVSGYLGYRLRNPHFPDVPITLRMLLTHTSSLRDDAFYFWPAKSALRDVLVPGGTLHAGGVMWARNAPPGAYFSYSNLGWGVIGTVMERVTGERFDRLMKRLVLDPLGVRGGFNPAEFAPGDLENVAALYCKCREVGDKEVWNPAGPWIAQVDDHGAQPPGVRADASYEIGSNGTVFGPQGNLRISAAGLGRVMLMLMNRGELDRRRLLKPQTVDEMLRIQWRADGRGGNGDSSYGARKQRFNARGLGTHVFLDISGDGAGDRLVEGGGFPAVGHLGDAYGLSGAFAFDPVARNGIIFLIGGTAFDPRQDVGGYSSLHRHEERILTLLHERAILEKLE